MNRLGLCAFLFLVSFTHAPHLNVLIGYRSMAPQAGKRVSMELRRLVPSTRRI